MFNGLDLDFRDKATQAAIASMLLRTGRAMAAVTPKRATVCYGGFLLGLALWLTPLSRKAHPVLTLAFTCFGASAIACAQGGLDELQKDQDEAEENDKHRRALRLTAREAVSTTATYADTAAARLAISQRLPGHLIEPDLLPASAEQKPAIAPASREAFDAFLNEGNDHADDQANDHDDHAPVENSRKAIKPKPTGYKFFTRKNPQNKSVKERCVDLKDEKHYAGLPIVDLAYEMAADSRGCMGIGSTGCGKSELLKQAIAAQHKLDETSDFTVFAHKSANSARGESLDYAGMERSQDCIVFTASQTGVGLSQAAERFESRLKVLNGLIEEGSAVPSVVVIDQSNQGLMACDKAAREASRDQDPKDKSDPDYKYLRTDYQGFINTVLVDGREKLVKAWTFGHSNTNKSAGVEHQVKQNIFFIGLGRAGNYASVWNPLKDERFIADKPVRDRLSKELSAYLAAHQKNGAPVNVVIAISNCGRAGWRLIVLPQYAPVVPIDLGVTNPTDESVKPVKEPDQAEPCDTIAAARAQLEKKSAYTEAQVSQARAVAKWLKAHGRSQLVNGLISPWKAWELVPGISSVTELEIALQILSEYGGGEFQHESDGSMRWRPADKLLGKAQPSADDVQAQRESIKAVLKTLARKNIGQNFEYTGFLNASKILRQRHNLTVPKLKRIIDELERMGLVRVLGRDRSMFKTLPHEAWHAKPYDAL